MEQPKRPQRPQPVAVRPRRPQPPTRPPTPAEEEATRLVRKRDAVRRWCARKSPEERAEFARWYREECVVYPPLAGLYRIVPAGAGWWKAIRPFGDDFTYRQTSSVVKATATTVICAQTEAEVRALMGEHHKTWKEHKE